MGLDGAHFRPALPARPLRLPRSSHYLPLVNLPRTLLVVGLLLAGVGCNHEPERLSLDRLPASTRAPAASSVLRFAAEGGPARLYRVPSLEASAWKMEDKLPAVERIVGADPEQGLVFALD